MFRYAVVGTICLLTGGASAQSPSVAMAAPRPVTAMEEPMPGDFWTYDVRDEISGTVTTRNNVVTEVTAAEISVRYSIVGKETSGLNVYDRSWNIKSGSPWKYRPHDGSGIKSPLKTGANWSFSGENINGDT
ncbi:MAG: hypothetical protein JO141_27670, partial [Bradyrhizobium sp.]|nr:hypothetical protein [Bradyrhizobium sp.]